MEFINHIVFNEAWALMIPSGFFMYKMLTSSSVTASATFGLFRFLSFFNSLLRASNWAFRVCSNSRSSIMFFGCLQVFIWWLKLKINPLRLEASNSSPSFLFTVMINALNKSFTFSGGISYRFLSPFFSFKNAIKMAMSLHVFDSVFLFSQPLYKLIYRLFQGWKSCLRFWPSRKANFIK